MTNSSIAQRAHRITLLAGLHLAAAVAACGSDTPSPAPDAASPEAPDAAAPDAAAPDASTIDALPATFHRVRGMIAGLSAPIALELQYPGGSETLDIAADGPFEFSPDIPNGATYTVSLADAAPCVLAGESGRILDADAEVKIACNGVMSLSGLSLTGFLAPNIDFSPETREYTIDVSLLQQSTVVTATAANPELVTLEIAGTPVQSGVPSSDYPLALGPNPIDIVVKHPTGLAWIYRITVNRAPEVTQYAYGKASNTAAGSELGWSMAIWGDTLVIGARNEDSGATGVNGNQADTSAPDSGAVYVFRRTSGTTWQQEAYLKASNTGAGDSFGYRVALFEDTLAVGAILEDSGAAGINGNQADNSVMDSGAVYIFRRTGTTWQQEAYLKASNPGATDCFGFSVAVYENTLAVSSLLEDSSARGINGDQTGSGAADSGAVYIFQHNGTTWQQEAYIKASNTGAGDNFGYSMALWQDTLAVGAWGEDSSAPGVGGNQSSNSAGDSGAAYVFRRTAAAPGWQQEAYIKASNPSIADYFGRSLALHGDTLAVGAVYEDSAATGVGGNQRDDTASQSGAAYVFRRTDTTWRQEAYVKASNTGAGDQFGRSVALWGDNMVIGAYQEDSAATGANGAQDNNGVTNSGAVYVFQRAGTAWQQGAYLKASNPGADDQFGISVALEANTLVVGAYLEDSQSTGIGGAQSNNNAMDSGAVYIFH